MEDCPSDFFGRLHSIDNITKDIEAGKIDVLIVDEKMVGTASRTDNHITRVYVLPEYEDKDFSSFEIQIKFKYQPSDFCIQYLQHVNEKIESLNVAVIYDVTG